MNKDIDKKIHEMSVDILKLVKVDASELKNAKSRCEKLDIASKKLIDYCKNMNQSNVPVSLKLTNYFNNLNATKIDCNKLDTLANIITLLNTPQNTNTIKNIFNKHRQKIDVIMTKAIVKCNDSL